MVSRAIKDLLNKVMWGELDFLVVDLPPGTGDPSITIAQSIPDASLVIVTTPQKVALADVKKAIHMFKKWVEMLSVSSKICLIFAVSTLPIKSKYLDKAVVQS